MPGSVLGLLVAKPEPTLEFEYRCAEQSSRSRFPDRNLKRVTDPNHGADRSCISQAACEISVKVRYVHLLGKLVGNRYHPDGTRSRNDWRSFNFPGRRASCSATCQTDDCARVQEPILESPDLLVLRRREAAI